MSTALFIFKSFILYWAMSASSEVHIGTCSGIYFVGNDSSNLVSTDLPPRTRLPSSKSAPLFSLLREEGGLSPSYNPPCSLQGGSPYCRGDNSANKPISLFQVAHTKSEYPIPSKLSEISSLHHSLTTAMQHQKKKVRFIGYPLIKKHASVLVSRRANCVLFQPCDRTLEATSSSSFYI
jgi:hypothetical protein